jgi:perosamine synthetase
MIRLARPLLGAEEEEAVVAVLRSGWLVQGPRVASFEGAVAEHVGVDFGVACSSGTAALQLALAALDLPPGTPVAVPTYTFPATINVVLLAGLRPVPVDIDPTTYNLDPEDARRVLTGPGAPPVLLAVDQFGLPAPLDELDDLDVTVVEDAACALGAALELGGETRMAGDLGVLGCFSFHPRKLITTGEGGVVTTRDAHLDEKLRMLRNHGIGSLKRDGRRFERPGWNLRLTEMQAAVGGVQLGRLDGILADRRRIAQAYDERLSGLTALGLGLPRTPAGAKPNHQSYVVRLPRGLPVAGVIEALRLRNVEINIGAQALHKEPAYRDLPGFDRDLPGTDEAFARAIALPMPPGLTDDELDRVCDELTDVIG